VGKRGKKKTNFTGKQQEERRVIDKEKFYTALSQGNMDEVSQLTREALNSGHSAGTILKDGLIPSMEEIGGQFKNGEIFLPEVLIAARAMHASLAILKPILSKSENVMTGRVVLGTVRGDLHDIGKNLVGMMLEGGGFEVIDLGIDVPADNFVESIKKYQPQAVGMSALLTTTMLEMKTTLKKIEEAGLRNRVKVVIGGAPTSEKFVQEIGADGYAPDAGSAVSLVKSLISK
jgi:5-methyltetrahydrofolate--homocysteine methyltransferase